MPEDKKSTFIESCLQTLSALYFALALHLYFICFFILAYITFFTRYWPLLPVLIFWTWYDRETPHKGGRRSRIFRKLPTLKYLRDYFPIDLVKTADLDKDKNYIFGCHPHGIVCAGTYGNFGMEHSPAGRLFPGLQLHTAIADFNFLYPLMREYVLSVGCISASVRSLKYILDDSKKGKVVVLLIGGASECRYANEGQYKIILKKRKGFVKLALITGCCLVPVVSYGENDIYDLVTLAPDSLLHSLQQFLKRITGIIFPLFFGRFKLGYLLPKRRPITTVVGKPIQVPKVAEPTEEQIDQYHSVYTEELMKLFEEHKHKYVKDPENTHLIIAE